MSSVTQNASPVINRALIETEFSQRGLTLFPEQRIMLDLLENHNRIFETGLPGAPLLYNLGPRRGKTTLAGIITILRDDAVLVFNTASLCKKYKNSMSGVCAIPYSNLQEEHKNYKILFLDLEVLYSAEAVCASLNMLYERITSGDVLVWVS